MSDPTRLVVDLRHPDGFRTRFADDEEGVERIPQGLTFSHAVPGGHKMAGFGTSRRGPIEEWGDMALLDDTAIYGPGQGNAIAWEGYQQAHPRRTGAEDSTDLDALGYAGKMLWDPFFAQTYLDRDPSSWSEPPAERMQAIEASGNPYGVDHAVTIGPKQINFDGTTLVSVESASTVEAWYQMGAGQLIDRFIYVGTEKSMASLDGPELLATDNRDGTAADVNALTLDAAGAAGTVRTRILTTDRRYAYLRLRSNATYNKSAGSAPQRRFRKILVVGNQGLPLQAITNDLYGIFGDDLIADIIARGVPSLTFTRGVGGTIAPCTFVVPHLKIERGTPDAAVALVNAYYMRDWLVDEGSRVFPEAPQPTFHWREPNVPPRRWEARRSDGAEISLAGVTSDDVVNAAKVIFTDTDGETKTAGPPGSGSDIEDSALEDTSSTNPVNAHGSERKAIEINMGHMTTQLGAVELGVASLNARSEAPQRGDVVARGMIRDRDTQEWVPSWQARGGDTIAVTDEDNVDRRIVERGYAHAERAATCSVDTEPDRLEAVMEQLGVVTIGRVKV